jgi:hypothetical protein
MSKIKFVLLGLLAMFAASLAASTPASAHEYLVEGKAITEKIEVEGTSQTGKLESTILGSKVSIQCEEDLTREAFIEEKGKSKGKIEFKNCIVLEFSKGKRVFLTTCEVKEPATAEFTDELVEHSIDEFKPALAEETFVELEIKTCALKGKYKVKGSQVCAIPEEEFEQVIHHLICTPAGSKLKLGSEAAQLFGEESLKLISKKPWSGN